MTSSRPAWNTADPARPSRRSVQISTRAGPVPAAVSRAGRSNSARRRAPRKSARVGRCNHCARKRLACSTTTTRSESAASKAAARNPTPWKTSSSARALTRPITSHPCSCRRLSSAGLEVPDCGRVAPRAQSKANATISPMMTFGDLRNVLRLRLMQRLPGIDWTQSSSLTSSRCRCRRSDGRTRFCSCCSPCRIRRRLL